MRESGVNWTVFDFTEDNLGVRVLLLDIFRFSTVSRASSSGGTWLTSFVEWEDGVEPKHVDVMVIPDGHDKGHTSSEGFSHILHTSLGFEGVGLVPSGLLVVTGLLGEGVVGLSANGHGWVGNDSTILHVVSLDLREDSVV